MSEKVNKSASETASANPKPNFEHLRLKDRQKVRGKFIFHEIPGGRLDFPFRKWFGDPVESFSLTDGEIYTIPLGVAKHLNKDCKYPIHSFIMGEDNKPAIKVNQWVRRCSFQSLEFMDMDELTPVGETKH